MLHRNPGVLVRVGVADAYAEAVEYIKLPERNALRDEALTFQRYLPHPTHGLAASSYSDDTQMTVANTRVLVRCGDDSLDPWLFADEYVYEFNYGGRRKGYSKGLQGILERVQTGAELIRELKPDSVKNGAAMRSVVFGVLPTISRVLSAATIQASITHDTAEGRFSARAVALMSHAALYEDIPLSCLGNYCQFCLPLADSQKFGYVFSQPWPGGQVGLAGTSSAITTVHAVVSVLAQENSLMGILRQVIEWGGDTDSVASIAWGIASARYQDEKLPEFMERDLEGGSERTGVKYLRGWGEALMNSY